MGIKILALLTSGETSVSELAAPIEMTLPAITKHLKVLENAGLISRSRKAQWRPCRLEAAPLREEISALREAGMGPPPGISAGMKGGSPACAKYEKSGSCLPKPLPSTDS